MWTGERANIREYLWHWDRACREYGGALLLHHVDDRALARHALEGVLAFRPRGDDPTDLELQITEHPPQYLTDGAIAAALRLIERPDQIRSLEISLNGDNPSLQYISLPRFPALERLALRALPIVSLTGLSGATRLSELEIHFEREG